MKARIWLTAQDPQFDGFLFAPVGDDGNGMRVSVLSVLARLGVDPWQEAKHLAGLPEDSARQRLDTLIVALPGIPSLPLDHLAITHRLIALLPRKAGFRVSTQRLEVARIESARMRSNAFVAYFIMFLLSQTLLHVYEPAAQGDAVGATITASEIARK